MSALGLFQTDGGCRIDPVYKITSPLFERAVIGLDPRYGRGERFIMEARNNGPKNVYMQSARFNGRELTRPWVPAKDVLAGGHLILEMGPKPNKEAFRQTR